MPGEEADGNEEEIESVAIKKIELKENTIGMLKRTLREMKILRLLQHENLLTLYSPLPPKSR